MNITDKLFRSNKVIKINKEFEDEHLVKFMTKFFVFAGIWKSGNDHQHNSMVAIFNLTVLTVAFLSISYMFILKYNDIDMNTEILLHFVEIFHTICTQIMLIWKRQNVARLAEVFTISLDRMDLPVNDRQSCVLILRKEQDSFLRVMKMAFAAIVSVYISVIIDSNAFLVFGNQKLLYPTWFPFDTDVNHIWFYYLAVVFQLLVYIELLFVDLAAVGLWYGTINSVSGMLHILGMCFQEEEEPSGANKTKCLVDFHNRMKELIKDLNLSVGIIFLEVVLTSQIAICFCGFHVVQAIYTRESTRLFKFFIGVGVFTLMLFVYCTSGQKLINKSPTPDEVLNLDGTRTWAEPQEETTSNKGEALLVLGNCHFLDLLK
ncbi:hypothetical protein J6590_042577 [Homalodisca vitripennis]|nr:hypothetical protein J6590_042577 [Homalodisca vitripennis]